MARTKAAKQKRALVKLCTSCEQVKLLADYVLKDPCVIVLASPKANAHNGLKKAQAGTLTIAKQRH